MGSQMSLLMDQFAFLPNNQGDSKFLTNFLACPTNKSVSKLVPNSKHIRVCI